MNDFLEKLEIGEGKIKLSKEEIKAILAEHGKSVKTETEKVESKLKKDIETYKSTIEDLKEQMSKAPTSNDIESLKKTIADYEAKEQQRLADEKAKKDDEILTNNIVTAIGDKQFVNDYTRNAIINDIKQALKDSNNGGKSAKDLFEEMTKDKSDIFANPNPMQDMAGMGDSEEASTKKDIPLMW